MTDIRAVIVLMITVADNPVATVRKAKVIISDHVKDGTSASESDGHSDG